MEEEEPLKRSRGPFEVALDGAIGLRALAGGGPVGRRRARVAHGAMRENMSQRRALPAGLGTVTAIVNEALREWLQNLGLEELHERLIREGVDLEAAQVEVLDLLAEDLTGCGVAVLVLVGVVLLAVVHRRALDDHLQGDGEGREQPRFENCACRRSIARARAPRATPTAGAWSATRRGAAR